MRPNNQLTRPAPVRGKLRPFMALAGAVALAFAGSSAVAQIALPANGTVTPPAANPAPGAVLASLSAFPGSGWHSMNSA